jgi:50S ribosomal protein L16 3-hydroxylase
LLAQIRWRRADVARFVGASLSEPKPHVLFAPPRRPLAPAAFAAAARTRGVRLAGTTLLLHRAGDAFINGETVALPAGARRDIGRLADRRLLPGANDVTAQTLALLYTWYRSGYLLVGATHE